MSVGEGDPDYKPRLHGVVRGGFLSSLRAFAGAPAGCEGAAWWVLLPRSVPRGDVGAGSLESMSHSGWLSLSGQTARGLCPRVRGRERVRRAGGVPEFPGPPGWAVSEPLRRILRSGLERRRGPARIAVGIARRLRVGPAARAAGTYSQVGVWRRESGYPVAAVTVFPSEAAVTGTALLSRV